MKRRNVLKGLGAIAGAGTMGATGLLATSAAAQSAQPIRIGYITSLSGAQASIGQSMLLGAQIAVDQVNKVGGVNGRKLELVVRDDKAKPADAALAARELAGSGVNLLCGVLSSASALAIAALVEQEKAIVITCAAHSDRLTKENFVRNYFRVTDNPYMRERALAKMAAQRYPNVTSWSGVIPDHEYGRTTWACFQDGLLEFYPAIAKKKPTIIQPIKTAYGVADYRGSVTAAMAVPAEGFMMSPYGGDAVTFFKQAEPFGFLKKAKLIIDTGNELVVAKAMKQDFPEMWMGSHWHPGAFEDVAISREIRAEVLKRNGDRHPFATSESHAAVMAYVKAIQAAGSTETDAVIKALESITFDTATGPRHFRKEDHQAIKPVLMIRARGNAKAADGIEILEFVKIPGADVIDPATPGVPLKVRSV